MTRCRLHLRLVLLVVATAGPCHQQGGGVTANMLHLLSGELPVTDPCLDDKMRAVMCRPEFVNAAAGRHVQATSTCGLQGPDQLCSRTIDGQLSCELCDGREPSHSFPASHLTDLNNPPNFTCWKSAPLVPGELLVNSPSLSSTAPLGSSLLTNLTETTVTLTLSLQKNYELTYVSIQFCQLVPDSLVIYKSSNFGHTWTAMQYYSSDCQGVFGLRPDQPVTRANEQQAVCSQSAGRLGGGRVAFSTLQDRPSGPVLEQSAIMQDWVTATDVRVQLTRLLPTEGAVAALDSAGSSGRRSRRNSLYQGPLNFYAMADLSVGGRCKCNGHASRCISDAAGQLTCDCQHNTAGRDCERCKPFHFDRPWSRANKLGVNVCKACECNLHARKCRFNMELFKLSGRRSGGVCLGCRHNTDGRHCHYCREGFYRDTSKPLQHHKACKACACHPIGSQGKTCNQTTGQCTCKEGVTGLTCNRCSEGFQQSRSPVAPCIKIPDVAEVKSALDGTRCDSKCRSEINKVGVKRFCNSNFAILVRILDKQKSNGYVRYTIDIMRVHKQSRRWRLQRGTSHFYVSDAAADCRCPNLELKKSYLLLGKDAGGRSGMILTKHTRLLAWQSKLNRSLRRIKQRARKICPR